jgi:hypothetical protein
MITNRNCRVLKCELFADGEGGSGGRVGVPAVRPGRGHLHVLVHLRAAHQILLVRRQQ